MRRTLERLESRLGTTPGAAVLFLSLLAIAFLPVLRGSRSFFSYDLMYEHLPVWHTVQEALLEGDSPFWLDGLYMGHPLLFHQEAPLFYPLTVPLLLTGAPVHRLADLFSLLHVALAGLSAFWLVRSLTPCVPAALFGGVAWMLSARTVQGVTWPNAVGVTAYTPLILLSVLLLSRGERRRGLLLGALSGGLALLLARPQSVLGLLPALGAFAVAGTLLAASRRRYVLDLGIAAGLALLLGAPSVVPSALILPETTRQGGLSPAERDDGALTRADLDQLVLPVDRPGRWPEAATYPGLAALVLFLLSFRLVRKEAHPEGRTLLVALAVGALLGLAFAFGASGPYALVSGLPLLSGFRSPVRFLAAAAIAVAVGSALAVSALSRRPGRGRALAWGLVAFLAVDLTLHAFLATPTVPVEALTTEPRLAAYLRSLPRDPLGVPYRYWSLGLLAPVHTSLGPRTASDLAASDHLNNGRGMMFGLDAVQGAGPALRRTDQLLSTRNLRVAELGGAARIVIRDPPLLPGVDGAAPRLPKAHVVRVDAPLPRALLLSRAITLPPSAVLPALLDPAFPVRETVLLEDGPGLEARGASPTTGGVRVIRWRPGRISLETTAEGPAILLVLQAWEAGWTATVDAQESQVERADFAFQAVRLAAGRHRVELAFRPRGLREGLLLALVGVLGLVLAVRRRPAIVTDRAYAPAPDDRAHRP